MARKYNKSTKKTQKEEKPMVENETKKQEMAQEEPITSIEPITTDTTDSKQESSNATEATTTPNASESKTEQKPKAEAFFDDPVLDQYLREYVDGIKTKNVAKAAAALKNIITTVVRNSDIKHVQALFNFFNKYKDSILVETVALQGIERFDQATRGKIEILYTIMRTLTKYPQRKDKINWDVVRKVLNNEKVVNWLIGKSKAI